MEIDDADAPRAAAARVLGVAADASPAEIRRAYRAAVKRTHPDLQPASRIEEFVRVHAAFEELVGRHAPAVTNAAAAAGSRLATPSPKPSSAAVTGPSARVVVLDPAVRARIDRFVAVRAATAQGADGHTAARRLDVVA